MSQKTALIIDDEKNIRLTLSKCLSYIDVVSDEAINGEDGLHKLEEKKYDIIFLDLKMQGMDGLEVLKTIKERDSSASVVIITAHGTVDIAVEAMKLGAADFMQKPFTPQEVTQITNEILSRKTLAEKGPDNYQSYIQFAKENITLKKYAEAEDNLKKAIEIHPNEPEPKNILGAVMEIQGRLEEARKLYKAALDLDPGYLKAQRNLIRINEKIKDSSQK